MRAIAFHGFFQVTLRLKRYPATMASTFVSHGYLLTDNGVGRSIRVQRNVSGCDCPVYSSAAYSISRCSRSGNLGHYSTEEVHMEFSTRTAMALADNLAGWQKLNVAAFLPSPLLQIPRAVGFESPAGALTFLLNDMNQLCFLWMVLNTYA